MSVQYTHPDNFSTETKPTFDADSNRVEYKFNSILGRIGREFIFVDKLFEKRPSGIHGAVGTRMRPVHEKEAERKKEQYMDEEKSPIKFIYEETNTVQSWKQWIETQFTFDGLKVIYDTSYSYKYGEPTKNKTDEEGIMNKNNIAIVECTGGGRLFNTIEQNFDSIYDEELHRLVKETEENGLGGI